MYGYYFPRLIFTGQLCLNHVDNENVCVGFQLTEARNAFNVVNDQLANSAKRTNIQVQDGWEQCVIISHTLLEQYRSQNI